MLLRLKELQNLCKTDTINLNTAVAVVFAAGLATPCFSRAKSPIPSLESGFFVRARKPGRGVCCRHSVAMRFESL